jgi:hypothetical protein
MWRISRDDKGHGWVEKTQINLWIRDKKETFDLKNRKTELEAIFMTASSSNYDLPSSSLDIIDDQ